MTGIDRNSEIRQVNSTLARVLRIKSAFLVVVALLIAAVGYFVLLRVRLIAEDFEIELSAISLLFLKYPGLIIAATLPAIATSIIGARARRHTWLWLTITTLLLLIPVAVVLYCFIQVVGSMYQYQRL